MKYDAFISYRHSELDMYVAKKLHKGLETFKVPRSVKKIGGKTTIKRVFRDQEELPIGSDLGDNIQGALAESEFLIVVCSPRLPQSVWCLKEITSFIEMHDREHILAVLIEGEPGESFPQELLVDEDGRPVEPLAADVRGANKREVDKKLKSEIVRLAAPLLHCTYDDLKQRHRERRMKKIAAIVGTLGVLIAGLGIGFGVYNAKMAAQIEENYKGKQISQSKYLAETSEALLKEGDRRAAALVAKAALPENGNRPYVPEAELALSEALYTYRDGSDMEMDRQLQHELPVNDFNYNIDGSYITSVDEANTVYLWETEFGKCIQTISPSFNDSGYALSIVYANVIDDFLVVIDESTVKAYDFDGKPVWEIGDIGTVTSGSANLGKSFLVANTYNGLFFIDTKKGKIISQYEKGEEYFSGTPAISSDGKYVVMSVFSSNALFNEEEKNAPGKAVIYDVESGERFDVITKYNYAVDYTTGENGDFYILSSDSDTFSFERSVDKEIPIQVEKFSVGSEQPVWSWEIGINAGGMFDAHIDLKWRAYEDETGNHKEVLVLAGNTLTAWDDKTGEKLGAAMFSGSVKGFVPSEVSAYGYMGESNGNINLINCRTGYNYTQNKIEIDISIRDMKLGNGALAISTSMSPNITILTKHKGPTMAKGEDFGHGISKLSINPSNTVYAVYLNSETGYSVYDILFYDVKTGDKLCEYNGDPESYSTFAEFISDDLFAYTDKEYILHLINVRTGEVKDIPAKNEDDLYYLVVSGPVSVSCDGKYVIMFSKDIAFVINTEDYSVTRLFEDREYSIKDMAVTSDGRVFAIDLNKGLLTASLDGSTGSIPGDNLRVSSTMEAENSLVLSPDEKSIMLCCMDKYARVIDLETLEVTHEIPFNALFSFYAGFSKDSSKLYLQGDDHYFKIYDLEKNEYVFNATEQWNTAERIIEFEDTIGVVNYVGLGLIDKESFSEKAEIECAGLFFPESGKILCKKNSSLFEFTYTPYTELLSDLEKAFPGEELSSVERAKYHVE